MCDILLVAERAEPSARRQPRDLEGLDSQSTYGRKLWGLLCLELWQRAYHDRAAAFRRQAEEIDVRMRRSAANRPRVPTPDEV